MLAASLHRLNQLPQETADEEIFWLPGTTMHNLSLFLRF